tara:strand:+ start:111 stop:722 length:612 start_codon:yes stop_codon:yes gene_type:complete
MKLHYELQKYASPHIAAAIKQYENIVPEVLCKELIEWFENSKTFRIDDHRKQSQELQIVGDPRSEAIQYKHLLFDYIYPLGIEYELDLHKEFYQGYLPKDEPLTKIFNTGFRSLQIQKYTPKDKGYSAVHIESGPDHIKKYLAVILYLNDVHEGGETVFPMGGTAIEPQTGKVAIWPTGIPFYHCGNKAKTDKYIITSWFEFM